MTKAEKYKVLVVDDSPVMAKLTAKNVESLGYEAAVRSNSTLAFSYVGNNKADLILMDVELMGSRYDGIRTAKAIRAKFNIPVVFITGHDDAKIFEEANLDSSFDVLMKPYDLRQLKMQMEVAIYNNRIERKTKEYEIWLNEVLTLSTDGMILLNPDNTIKTYNIAASRMLSLKSEVLTGLKVTDVIRLAKPGSNTSGMVVIDYIKGLQKLSNRNLILLSDDGDDIPVKASLKNVVDGENNEIGRILLLITSGKY